MANLAEFFVQDHRHCDAQWAAVEAAADGGDTAAVTDAWQVFQQAMERHLSMEEQHLFPAFEAATGMTGGGPTFVMRAEHEQMRGLMSQMKTLVESGQTDELLDQGDTLLMLIQQHNAKEEGMLYPMAQQRLGAAGWQAVRSKLPA